MKKLYYLQDQRSVVGNSILWWAIEGKGYTCDIRCAQVWTKEELVESGYWTMDGYKHEKFKVWPKEKVDNLIQHHIDHQDLFRDSDNSVYDNNPHTLVAWRKDLVKK